MKIGILTQPLHDNYGGLLQAYALKETLKGLGHEVVIVNRERVAAKRWRILASKIKHALKGKRIVHMQQLSSSQKDIISKHTKAFREKHIPEQSRLITSNKVMQQLNNECFNAYVVGSDQCWRPRYSPSLKNYFLDFAQNCTDIKRISYAASFGTADWEFTDRQTKECKALLENFDAISVREKSGAKLIQQHLGRNDAVHVLDPTMLLQKSDYQKIIEQEKVSKSAGNLKIYILDKTDEKSQLIEQVETRLGLKQFEIMPKKRMQDNTVTDSTAIDFQFPNPAQWLKGFQDAQFVITDSFHGTLFSILFNVPFIAVGNVSRGMARFESLLEMFGFTDRLVSDINQTNLDCLLNENIDWSFANLTLETERAKALNFLTSSLK